MNATSRCGSARSGRVTIPRAYHSPFLSMKISTGSYFSGRFFRTAAPVFKETSYSLDGPPRITPTLMRAMSSIIPVLLLAAKAHLTILLRICHYEGRNYRTFTKNGCAMLPIISKIRSSFIVPAQQNLLNNFDARYSSALAGWWNVFGFSAENAAVDLLSDSGTGPLSPQQRALLEQGNKAEHRAYASRKSFFELQYAVWETFGLEQSGSECCFIPFPQGRAAEAVFFGCVRDALEAENCLDGMRVIIPSNSHFDTTRANVELCGFEADDIPVPYATDEMFLGNMNTVLLESLLKKHCRLAPDYNGLPDAVD